MQTHAAIPTPANAATHSQLISIRASDFIVIKDSVRRSRKVISCLWYCRHGFSLELKSLPVATTVPVQADGTQGSMRGAACLLHYEASFGMRLPARVDKDMRRLP